MTRLAARGFETQTIKLVVVIFGEVNDAILKSVTCNLQPSLCIALHHVKHVKILWVQVCAGWGWVVVVVGAGYGQGCGLVLWVGLWVRHTLLQYLRKLSDSMPKRMSVGSQW